MVKESNIFVIERRIYTTKNDELFLNKKLNICNKIYNTSVKHCIKQLEKLKQDVWFLKSMKEYIKYSKLIKEIENKLKEIDINISTKKLNNYSNKLKSFKSNKSLWLREINICIEAYGLSEYSIHSYMAYQKKKAFNKGIGINIVQKLGTNLSKSVNKAIFSGTKIYYRKYNQTSSFEDKRANSGIIYFPNDIIKVMGKIMKLKPIREKDIYLQEAMNSTIKYCRIVRKPFKNKYKYFLQIIMEGFAPKKIKIGIGKCGLDEGTSTIAYYNDTKASFYVLCENIKKYEKEIKKYMTKYERQRRLNNPQNYDENGKIIKGSRFKNTKNTIKTLMKLKNAYRKKSEYIKQNNNYLVNRLLEQCDLIIKEPMNFKALAKRAKETKRSNKISIVTKKDGSKKQIHKFRKKKRFGSSINKRAPGYFNSRLESQIKRYGGDFIDIDIKNYKASQYNHITKEAKKPKLSERTKLIGKDIVQRDLYSAFLLYCYKDKSHINFDECEKLFKDFLNKQEQTIKEERMLYNYAIKEKEELDKAHKNFGLNDF